MVRLEFKKFTNEQLKEVVKALLNNETYSIEYTNKEGEKKSYKVVENSRLYFDNNYSLSLSRDNNGNSYLSIDYLSVDDRVSLYKKKQEQEQKEVDSLEL